MKNNEHNWKKKIKEETLNALQQQKTTTKKHVQKCQIGLRIRGIIV